MSTIGSKPGAGTAPAASPGDDKTKPLSGWRQVAERLKANAKDTALSLASAETSLINVKGQVGGLAANLHFRAKLTEKVALKRDDKMVTSNVDRVAAKGVTWTRAGFIADGGANLLGFGYDRGVKVSAIVPTSSKVSVKSLVKLPADQGRLLMLNFKPRDITKEYAPGSEFHMQGHGTYSMGAVVGPDVSFFNLHAGAEIGAEVTWDKSAYAKTVTVQPNERVQVRLDRMSRLGGSVGAGAAIGYGHVDGDRRRNVGDFTQEPNHANIVSLHVGMGASTQKTIQLAGNFDMKTKNGQEAYRYVMEADPNKLGLDAVAAKRALEKMGMTVAYAEKQVQYGGEVRASVMKNNLVNIGSHTTSRAGTLYELRETDRGTVIDETKLSEKEYSRVRTGALPRWAKGEERESRIRMGAVSYNGAPEVKAMLMSLHVMDAKVTEEETKQGLNFASALGFRTDQRPTGVDGTGDMMVNLALTDPGVQRLDAMSREQFIAAFSTALGTITGSPVPWMDETIGRRSDVYWNERFKDPVSIKARWEEAINDLGTVGHGQGEGNRSEAIKRQYESSTGRNYYRDMNTWRSVEHLTDAFEKSRGKPLQDRGPFLKALSKLSSPDLRAAVLMVRNSGGGGIVNFDYSANGVSIHANPETKAPATVGEIVAEALDVRVASQPPAPQVPSGDVALPAPAEAPAQPAPGRTDDPAAPHPASPPPAY